MSFFVPDAFQDCDPLAQRPLATGLQISIDALRPTQVAVGMRAVERKRDRLSERCRKRRKLSRYLERNAIPAVRGPEGAFYIIDRHHLGLALLHSEIERAVIDVVADLGSLATTQFWRAMIDAGQAYPFDERGRRICHRDMPRSLDGLRDDPYRDLARSVREAGGFRKTSVPFAEFKWAEYFRPHVDRRVIRDDYDRAVRLAMRLAAAAPKRLPGHRHSVQCHPGNASLVH